jgi:hypothetical protein
LREFAAAAAPALGLSARCGNSILCKLIHLVFELDHPYSTFARIPSHSGGVMHRAS